jgi:hypothetical protein
MQIVTSRISFGRFRGSGPRLIDQVVSFPTAVTKAIAILTGTNFGFSPRDDHHLGMVEVSVQAAILPGNLTVRVLADLGVRDWSGEWDDDYEGWINYAVIAE